MEKKLKKDSVKNLNLAELKKQNKRLDTQKEVVIFIGEDETPYKFKMDENFRKTKQHKLLDDIVKFFNESNNDIELLEVATPYISLLIIKHFTNIEISENIDEALELLNILIDLEIFDKILNSLPDKEVSKIYKIVQFTLKNMEQNIEEGEIEAQLLEDKIKNQIVKDVLVDGKEQEEE